MSPQVTLITLGTADLARARAFYEALGWTASAASQPTVAFFHGNGGPALGLFGRDSLAEDAHVEDHPTGFAAVTLAHNLASREAVDAFFARALAAGARALKTPREVFWGGYSGYFADPDGHLWEIAHNPFFPFDAGGRLDLPE
ncbi:MAG TPA: VOC family protein [Beijerinckiaceae bacterium]